MKEHESSTVRYVLLGLLGLAVLAYVAQPRHWKPRSVAQSSVEKPALAPKTSPPKPLITQTKALLEAKRMCSKIAQNANILADYVGTGCKPAKAKDGTVDLVIVARKPIFYKPDTKKAWLLVIMGAVGKELTDHADVPIGDIIVTDTALASQEIMYWFPAQLAKTLRNRVHGGEMTLLEAYAELLEGMHRAQ